MDKIQEKIVIDSSTNMDPAFLKQAFTSTKVIFFDKNLDPKQKSIIKTTIENLNSIPECEVFSCRYMNLEKLPDLPKCRVLFVSNNKLKELPDLPNLFKLIASRNRLTSLPKLNHCSRLFVENNKLKALPNLPNVKTLVCRFNELENLPSLPKCIKLVCSNNRLIDLPDLPVCKYLDCSFNDIKKLPDLPVIDTLITKGNLELTETPDQKKAYAEARKKTKEKDIVLPKKIEGSRTIHNFLDNELDHMYFYKMQKYKQKCKELKKNVNQV